jgi:hypothetical protein
MLRRTSSQIEQIPLSMLVGPVVVVVDLTRRSEPLRERQMIVWSDIEPYAKHLREGLFSCCIRGGRSTGVQRSTLRTRTSRGRPLSR